ncbi:hypothetical protein ABW19_dt0202532 [Dactylella cylindrospora]|nr:hypothetical protein ABW19_dt0202532 [Dactylella cylindrospora]
MRMRAFGAFVRHTCTTFKIRRKSVKRKCRVVYENAAAEKPEFRTNGVEEWSLYSRPSAVGEGVAQGYADNTKRPIHDTDSPGVPHYRDKGKGRAETVDRYIARLSTEIGGWVVDHQKNSPVDDKEFALLYDNLRVFLDCALVVYNIGKPFAAIPEDFVTAEDIRSAFAAALQQTRGPEYRHDPLRNILWQGYCQSTLSQSRVCCRISNSPPPPFDSDTLRDPGHAALNSNADKEGPQDPFPEKLRTSFSQGSYTAPHSAPLSRSPAISRPPLGDKAPISHPPIAPISPFTVPTLGLSSLDPKIPTRTFQLPSAFQNKPVVENPPRARSSPKTTVSFPHCVKPNLEDEKTSRNLPENKSTSPPGTYTETTIAEPAYKHLPDFLLKVDAQPVCDREDVTKAHRPMLLSEASRKPTIPATAGPFELDTSPQESALHNAIERNDLGAVSELDATPEIVVEGVGGPTEGDESGILVETSTLEISTFLNIETLQPTGDNSAADSNSGLYSTACKTELASHHDEGDEVLSQLEAIRLLLDLLALDNNASGKLSGVESHQFPNGNFFWTASGREGTNASGGPTAGRQQPSRGQSNTQTSNNLKRRRPRNSQGPPGDDGEEDDNSNLPQSKKQDKGDERGLACPIAKSQPEGYHRCRKICRQNLSGIK